MDQIPYDLKQNLLGGRVVPFVAAGVSMTVRDRTTSRPMFPSWHALLFQAADCLDHQEIA